MDNNFNNDQNNENNSYGGYTGNPYSESSYSAYEPDPVPMTAKARRAMKKVERADRKRRERESGVKKPNIFAKIGIAVAGAVVLGGVAGIACYGVSYAGYSLFPIASQNSTDSTVVTQGATQTVTTYNQNVNTTVMDVSDMVSNVISSIVAVNGTTTTTSSYGFFGTQTYESTVSGSGIIIGSNETELLIATNAHVVEDVDNLTITTYDGSTISAVVKGLKSNYDLAVLAVNLSDIPTDAIYSFATLGETSEIKVGEAAIAIGNSLGEGISVTTGVVSALNKTITVDSVEYNNLIQTDAAINPGNSGGALFNAAGEVIGINSAKIETTGVEGMGYAISISSVMDIISDLSLEETKIKLSDDERGYLGITCVSINEQISAQYGYPVGVLVRGVTEGGAADVAGLVKNDIIYSVDGETVSSSEEMIDMLCYYAIGEQVEIEYYHMNDRGEFESKTVTVTLGEKPAE